MKKKKLEKMKGERGILREKEMVKEKKKKIEKIQKEMWRRRRKINKYKMVKEEYKNEE